MTFDYDKLRGENRRRYGTDIKRVGRLLLAKRYANRTHFIFEVLQNAEDALARRPSEWTGPRSVTFKLASEGLRVEHFGDPFNEDDVRGICAIGEGTKELTDIGRFGIGFKSVFAVSERPEVHSGPHAFAIEDYVLPVPVSPRERDPDETVFFLPFEEGEDREAFDDVRRGLRRLTAKTLLFLQQIEEIRWRAEDESSGLYLRESEDLDEWVRRVTLVGDEEGAATVGESWLVFSNSVTSEDGTHVGLAEIAFRIQERDDEKGETFRPVDHSPLIVYFPTVVETNLGFLVQGPYRTTPSRDNVPANAPWNKELVHETGMLLSRALRWLRDEGRLDVETLRCLPLEPSKLAQAHEGMFAPLFTAVKQALSSERLLPRADGGQVAADRALLSRTKELRDLLNPRQLTALFGEGDRRWWVTGEITRDRTPDLYQYLMKELEISEITPETFIFRLDDDDFLAAQPNTWIRDLYQFLSGQSRLRHRFKTLPLIRLEDGSHVRPNRSGDPQAYLPGTTDTEFPTVHAEVCDTTTSRHFLRSLGLSEPDPVDDVMQNILPKYRDEGADVSLSDYKADIDRITRAYETDSESRRETLVDALRDTPFVRAADADGTPAGYARPSDLYIPTQRLRRLFRNVAGIVFVDRDYECLRGEQIDRLLESAGAVRYVRPVQRNGLQRLSQEERRRLREQAGKPETSGQKDRIRDWELAGLEELLQTLPGCAADQRRTKARLLWKELAHLEERRGKNVFTGTYSWSHYGDYSKSFNAGFIRQLNRSKWVPADGGNLRRSDSVLFDDLGWEEHPFLQSKIPFKPPLLDEIAEKAGLDPGVLEVLKEVGVTSADDLRDRLGLTEEQLGGTENKSRTPENASSSEEHADSGDRPRQDPGRLAPGNDIDAKAREERQHDGGRAGETQPVKSATTREGTSGSGREGEKADDESAGGRRFISYVATDPEETAPDPDGLERQERMALEEEALRLILSREENWRRTSSGNPGFDLYKQDGQGQPSCWCEVKAMAGSLNERPVAMTRTQFEHARRRGESYWLYVVEHAGTDAARLVRIQDPAGKARSFTFDSGWRAVADAKAESDRAEG